MFLPPISIGESAGLVFFAFAIIIGEISLWNRSVPLVRVILFTLVNWPISAVQIIVAK